MISFDSRVTWRQTNCDAGLCIDHCARHAKRRLGGRVASSRTGRPRPRPPPLRCLSHSLHSTLYGVFCLRYAARTTPRAARFAVVLLRLQSYVRRLVRRGQARVSPLRLGANEVLVLPLEVLLHVRRERWRGVFIVRPADGRYERCARGRPRAPECDAAGNPHRCGRERRRIPYDRSPHGCLRRIEPCRAKHLIVPPSVGIRGALALIVEIRMLVVDIDGHVFHAALRENLRVATSLRRLRSPAAPKWFHHSNQATFDDETRTAGRECILMVIPHDERTCGTPVALLRDINRPSHARVTRHLASRHQ